MGVTEPEGFREFVATRSRPLLRTAWLLTGDWALAQDLLQTALAKTWPRWASVEDPDAYVRRAMVTTYASWWRRRWTAEVPTGEVPEQLAADDHALVEQRDEVLRALARLPRRQRAVVALRYLDDLTEAQVADALGMRLGTVKSTHAAALRTLRTLVPSEVES